MSCISNTTATSLLLEIDVSVHYTNAGFGSQNTPSVGVVKLTVGLTENVQAPRALSFVVIDHTMMSFCLILGAHYLVLHGISLGYSSGMYIQDGSPLSGISMLHCFLPVDHVERVLPLSVLKLELPVHTMEICVGVSGQWLNFEVERDGFNEIVGLRSLIPAEQDREHQRSWKPNGRSPSANLRDIVTLLKLTMIFCTIPILTGI